MKKSILKMFLLLSAGLTALTVNSCKEPVLGPDPLDENTPLLEVAVNSVTETSAELGINIAGGNFLVGVGVNSRSYP